MSRTAGGGKSEVGLSEVVGFVMILGLIAAALSIYLTYSVPAQGRNNEIAQMNTVSDTFNTYKFGLDSLIINNQVGSGVSNVFTMGTSQTYSTTGNSFFPVLAPVGSTALLSVNMREEYLVINSSSLIVNSSGNAVNTTAIPASPAISTFPLPSQPSAIWLNITQVGSADLTSRYSVVLTGANWAANVTLTPVYFYYNYTSSINCTATETHGGATYCTAWAPTYANAYQYNRTDIVISVTKNGVPILQNVRVYENITPGSYSINILDPAYGLSSSVSYPTSVSGSYSNLASGSSITSSLTAVYEYPLTYQEYTAPPGETGMKLASIEYDSQNNYWIQQGYYYEMGGIFLSQYAGTTYKQPPSLYITYNSTTEDIGIKVLEIYFANNTAVVGGSTPVQLKTTFLSNRVLPYAPARPNTQWVTLTLYSPDTNNVNAWCTAFQEAAYTNAGIPTGSGMVSISNTSHSCTMKLTGNITLNVSQIEFSAMVHNIGQAVT